MIYQYYNGFPVVEPEYVLVTHHLRLRCTRCPVRTERSLGGHEAARVCSEADFEYRSFSSEHAHRNAFVLLGGTLSES